VSANGEQTHEVHVSTTPMSQAIKRIGWTRTKRRWVPVNDVRKSERSSASR
jgi:hypothetical protein